MAAAEKKKLSPKMQIADVPADVYCVKFSSDHSLLCGGCGDGAIRVYGRTGRSLYTLQSDSVMPVTCMRFRPDAASNLRNVLLATGADGGIRHWHVTSSKCLNTIMEEGNQTNCLDYRPDGMAFATGGRDTVVRLYDETTKKLTAEFTGGEDESAGHANRVFSIKFLPEDTNLMISGGWDNTIQVWDTRAQHSVRSIFGPHVCGDSIDYDESSGTVLSGSWRAEEALQLWDFGTGKLLNVISWGTREGQEPCLLYTTQFSSSGGFIGAGGSGSNEAKVFDTVTQKSIGTVGDFEKGVYSVDFSQDNSQFLVGGGTQLRLIELRNQVARAPRQ